MISSNIWVHQDTTYLGAGLRLVWKRQGRGDINIFVVYDPFIIIIILLLLLLFNQFFFSALQSVVNLGFQYNLPPFLTDCGYCLPVFIPIIFKSSSVLSLQFYVVFIFHLLLPLYLLQSFLACLGFAFFQPDHTILP